MARVLGGGEHPVARRGVERVVADHEHVVPVVAGVEALAERVVAVVGRERLAGGEEPDLPGLLERPELRHDDLAGVVEVADLHPVDEEEVDVIGAQALRGSSPRTCGAAWP